MRGRMPGGQTVGSGHLAAGRSDLTGLERDHVDDSHVSLVASAPSSPEAILIGVALGALSALLVMLACGYGPGDVLRGLGPAALFLCTWISSTWLLTHDTGRVLVVLRRGCLMGALLWGVLAIQWSDVAQFETGRGGATPGADPYPTQLMSDVSSILVWVCVAGFALCWLSTRSPHAELETNRP